MKPTYFTPDEKDLIILKLRSRLRSYIQRNDLKRLINNIEETINKINSDFDNRYYPRHKDQISSCINEYLTEIEEEITHFYQLTPVDILTLNQEELEKIQLIDKCYSILEKNSFRKERHRFNDVFIFADKCKCLDTIGISRTDKNNVYKVGFINGNEVIKWIMSNEVNWLRHKEYIHCYNGNINPADLFSIIVTKAEAQKIINECDPVSKNEDTLKLTKFLINQ